MKYGCSAIKSHDWYGAKTDIDQIRHHQRKYRACHWEKQKAEKSSKTLRFDLEILFCTLHENISCWQHQRWRLPACLTLTACFHNLVFLLNIILTLTIWARLRRNLSYCAKSAIFGWCSILVLIFFDPEPPGGPSTRSARRSRPLGLSTGI